MSSSKVGASWLLVFSVFFGTSGAVVTWMTNATQPWTFVCPTGQTFKLLDSYFETTNDRVWNFTCSDVPTFRPTPVRNCEWSGYANQILGEGHFQCPDDAFVTGIQTEYDLIKRDRLFQFYCCRAGSYAAHECVYTPFANKYREVLYYRVPDDWVIRGVSSEYVASYDRLYRFNICKLDMIYTPEVQVQ